MRKIGESRLLTIAAPAYLKKHGEPQHPNDLQHHECLIYASDSTINTWPYREEKKPLQVAVRGRIVANNGMVLVEAAIQGMGIARQPDFIAAPFLARKKVKTILDDFEAEPLGIYAVLPSNRYVPHRVRVLIDHLAQHLAKAATY